MQVLNLRVVVRRIAMVVTEQKFPEKPNAIKMNCFDNVCHQPYE